MDLGNKERYDYKDIDSQHTSSIVSNAEILAITFTTIFSTIKFSTYVISS